MTWACCPTARGLPCSRGSGRHPRWDFPARPHLGERAAAGQGVPGGAGGAGPPCPAAAGADVVAFVDIDSQQKRVYGHAKQGAAFGHTKISEQGPAGARHALAGYPRLRLGAVTIPVMDAPPYSVYLLLMPSDNWQQRLMASTSLLAIVDCPKLDYAEFALKDGRLLTAGQAFRGVSVYDVQARIAPVVMRRSIVRFYNGSLRSKAKDGLRPRNAERAVFALSISFRECRLR